MITNEESIVLKAWESEISNLFNRPDEALNKFDTTSRIPPEPCLQGLCGKPISIHWIS